MVQDIGRMIPGSPGSLVAQDPDLMVTWKEDSGLYFSPNSTATLLSHCLNSRLSLGPFRRSNRKHSRKQNESAQRGWEIHYHTNGIEYIWINNEENTSIFVLYEYLKFKITDVYTYLQHLLLLLPIPLRKTCVSNKRRAQSDLEWTRLPSPPKSHPPAQSGEWPSQPSDPSCHTHLPTGSWTHTIGQGKSSGSYNLTLDDPPGGEDTHK